MSAFTLADIGAQYWRPSTFNDGEADGHGGSLRYCWMTDEGRAWMRQYRTETLPTGVPSV